MNTTALLHTAEESKPLLALLERYRQQRTEANGNAVLGELQFGNAELYVLVYKDTGQPAAMIGSDGLLNMMFASTTMEADLIGATEHDEEVTLMPHRAPAVMRMMREHRFVAMLVNGNFATEATVVLDEMGWRIQGPLLHPDAQTDEHRITGGSTLVN